jgi:hypothetical protein
VFIRVSCGVARGLYNPLQPFYLKDIISICCQKLKTIKMAVNMLTQEDLEQFKVQFFEGQKEFLNQIMDIATRLNEVQELSEFDGKPWLKSKDLEKLMGITSGTLQTLRNNGTVPYSKVGGVMLYSQDDIRKMIEQNKRNIQ